MLEKVAHRSEERQAVRPQVEHAIGRAAELYVVVTVKGADRSALEGAARDPGEPAPAALHVVVVHLPEPRDRKNAHVVRERVVTAIEHLVVVDVEVRYLRVHREAVRGGLVEDVVADVHAVLEPEVRVLVRPLVELAHVVRPAIAEGGLIYPERGRGAIVRGQVAAHVKGITCKALEPDMVEPDLYIVLCREDQATIGSIAGRSLGAPAPGRVKVKAVGVPTGPRARPGDAGHAGALCAKIDGGRERDDTAIVGDGDIVQPRELSAPGVRAGGYRQGVARLERAHGCPYDRATARADDNGISACV